FFCLYTEIVPAVYRYAMQNGLKIGKDFGVVGFASGVTFNNLMPELTYSKIDHFEMGRAACRMVINGIRGEKWKGLHIQIPNILVTKQST
ncbi:MAG: substrate-binding domain-containing protein, partial [Victivallaceae bacterium]